MPISAAVTAMRPILVNGTYKTAAFIAPVVLAAVGFLIFLILLAGKLPGAALVLFVVGLALTVVALVVGLRRTADLAGHRQGPLRRPRPRRRSRGARRGRDRPGLGPASRLQHRRPPLLVARRPHRLH
jgi:hypothetical protein